MGLNFYGGIGTDNMTIARLIHGRSCTGTADGCNRKSKCGVKRVGTVRHGRIAGFRGHRPTKSERRHLELLVIENAMKLLGMPETAQKKVRASMGFS